MSTKVKVEVPTGTEVSAAAAAYFLCAEEGGRVELVVGESDSKFGISAGSERILADDAVAAYAIALASEKKELLGNSLVEQAAIQHFCGIAKEIPDTSDESLFEILNQTLVLRTYIVGYQVSLADCVMWSRLARAAQKPKGPYLSRWFQHIDNLPAVTKAKKYLQDNAVTSGDWSEVMRLVKSQGTFDVFSLPGVEMGNVCTRFPPEPSGYLHIGHAKAALLNDFLARNFKGKLIVRFDDTNPDKEKTEFEENILRDLELLGIHPDKVEYTSDYFDKLLEVAATWLERGVAYVDMTPTEEMRAQRMECKENEYRSAPKEQNLKLWEEMKKGSEEGQKCCVRAKIDMQAKNGAMRDPIMYRCKVDVSHHRTGSKFKLYPSYDFSCPIVDSLEGVTHALRSSEYTDREVQYYWMCETAGLRRPYMWDFSRLNFKQAVLSKRKLQWFVDNKLVDGWTDPRFPTVQGIRRRGMTIQALRAFILSQGASKNTNLMEWDKIWTVNKRVIDPIAPRHTAIGKDANRVIVVNNADEEIRSVPKHKKNPDVGMKNVVYKKEVLLESADANSLKEGEVVTLMDWGNVKITKKTDTELEGEYLPDNKDFKKTQKFTWLAQLPDLAPATLVYYDHLITKDKLEEDDKMEDFVNKNSKSEESVLCDINTKLLQQGDVIQFERRGYFICDSVFVRENGRPMTFIEIPDGKGRKN